MISPNAVSEVKKVMPVIKEVKPGISNTVRQEIRSSDA